MAGSSGSRTFPGKQLVNVLISWINGLQTHQAALLGALIAALVGAIANIFTGLVRDFGAKAWFDRRDVQRSSDEVFRRYAEPLASATTSLYWRLKEILARDGRASFLTSVEPRTEFDQYKLLSTYFRLAATLGSSGYTQLSPSSTARNPRRVFAAT